MPRRWKIRAIDIQRSRANWYEWHIQARDFIKALPAPERIRYENAALQLTPPALTIYGGVPHNWPITEEFVAAARLGVDMNYVNPWYMTRAGWDELQRQWQLMPEPVDLYTEACVQVGDVVLTVHSADEKTPPLAVNP